MNRKDFLKKASIALATTAVLGPQIGKSAQGDLLQNSVHTLPNLPFATKALEPFIDTQTMEIHHGRHHKAYVDNLNKALATNPYLAKLSLDTLQARMAQAPAAIRNNGGGHFNHSLFWTLLSPKKQKATGSLVKEINKKFGSEDAFFEQFGKAGLSVFGSGWVWLNRDSAGELFISTTPNQDNPLMNFTEIKQGKPIIGLDVWEHAYYLKYQNLRAEYIKAFRNILNWQEAENRFRSA